MIQGRRGQEVTALGEWITQVPGEKVEVIGLDEKASSKRREIVAKVRREGRQYTVAPADV